MTTAELEQERWNTQSRMNGHISNAFKSIDEIIDTLTSRIAYLENVICDLKNN